MKDLFNCICVKDLYFIKSRIPSCGVDTCRFSLLNKAIGFFAPSYVYTTLLRASWV